MNNGKKFESDFKASVPKNVFYYRFKDGTASWDKGDNTRFQAFNICDCMMFDKMTGLWLCELKSHAGKSLPFSCIRDNQLKEMLQASEYQFVHPIFIINFRDVEKTFAIDAIKVARFIESGERKSIPIDWLEENGDLVRCRKLRVNYRYDISEFLDFKYYQFVYSKNNIILN